MKVGEANPTVNSPYTANLDGGSEWEYFEPVRVGDQISVTQYLSDISERRGSLGHMLFMVRETKYTNQFGNVVALQRTTGISYNPSN
jgi:hydroxyacyl-ACP dehydratase HTD2-like protein with hotdog domain